MITGIILLVAGLSVGHAAPALKICLLEKPELSIPEHLSVMREVHCPVVKVVGRDEAAACDIVMDAWTEPDGKWTYSSLRLVTGDHRELWMQDAKSRPRQGLMALYERACPELVPGGEIYGFLKPESDIEPQKAETTNSSSGGTMDEESVRRVVEATLAAKGAAANRAQTAPASDADEPSYHARESDSNLAVVIGIEKYSDIPEAQFAEHDAKAVHKHLLALGYPERNISMLLGQKATKSSLVKNLEVWLANNARPDSTVIVYFSGHGAPNPKTGEAFLVPWDGDPQFLEETGYPLKRLYSKLGALPVKRVIVAIDSCFSGAGGRSVLQKGVRPLIAKVDLGIAGSSKIVSLTASSADQISGILEDKGHGLFTYYFLKGLNSGASTVDGLYSYITPKVRDEARRQNRDQKPQLLPASAAGIPLR